MWPVVNDNSCTEGILLGDDMENTNTSHAWTHLPHQLNEAIIYIKL